MGSSAVADEKKVAKKSSSIVERMSGARKTKRSPSSAAANVKVLHLDGWTALHGLIPPKERRGLVLIDPPYEETGEMERLVSDLPGPVETFLRHGDPATELASLVAEKRPDLLVMATHGRTGLGRALQGSVAEGVLRAAACAVLTCRTPEGCRMPSLEGPVPPEAA